MPPRIRTGAKRPQIASMNDFKSGGRGRSRSARPKPCLREIRKIGTRSAMPARMPGIMPAAKSAGTEACGTSTE
jgi:hypothetical protein